MAAPSTPFSSSMSFTSETKRFTDDIQVVVELPVQPASQEGELINHEASVVQYRSYWRRFVGLICLVRTTQIYYTLSRGQQLTIFNGSVCCRVRAVWLRHGLALSPPIVSRQTHPGRAVAYKTNDCTTSFRRVWIHVGPDQLVRQCCKCGVPTLCNPRSISVRQSRHSEDGELACVLYTIQVG